MKKRFVTLTILSFCSLALAQDVSVPDVAKPQDPAAIKKLETVQSAQRSPFSDPTCSYNFSSGAVDSGLRYCVTANGNIPQIETPELHQNVGLQGEGYGLCDLSTGIVYNDFAARGDTGNWGPPTLLSQTATAVKIARTSTDGAWTLTQTITQVPGNSPSIRIVMALKNNTAQERTVWLIRYVDADIDGLFSNDFDFTMGGATGFNSGTLPNGSDHAVGLVLENATNQPFVHQAFAQETFLPPPFPCNPLATVPPGPLVGFDGSLVMAYQPSVNAHSTVLTTMIYRGW